MKDDLPELSRLRVPEPDPVKMERARHRAGIAFENAQSLSEEAPTSSRGLQMGMRGLFKAVVLILMIMAVVVWTSHRDRGTSVTADQGTLLRQFEAAFPNSLRAVVERGGKVEVDLAEEGAATSNDQGILVTLRGKKDTVSVLSFSGNAVCVDLEGRRLCFELLVTDHGEVILSGKDFVWTKSAPVRLAGCHVEAATLERKL